MEIIKGHAYDITKLDKAINRNGDEHTQIRCWCMDRNSHPFLLIFDNFPHTCKLELPTIVETGGRILEWTMDNARDVFNSICRVLKKKEVDPPSGWKFLKLTRLYNYSTKKYPYMLLTFNTHDNMSKVTRMCKKVFLRDVGQVNLVFRETHIDNYNKMFSLKNLGPTQKFKCSAVEVLPDDPNRISKQGPVFRPFREYIGDWKTLEAIYESWISYPIICSWDIESYSHNHRCFPQKHCPDDEIFSISATFQQYMKPETRKDYVIIMGFTNPIENVITINVKTEADVIEKFFEIIEKEDPDVFIGYNIFGFDYGYLDARIKDVGDEWKNVGRLIEEGCDIKNLSWSSDAYGHQNMDIFDCPGRISIDMLTQIKRDFKLSMYNLNAVGKFFLGEEKVDLKAIEMFQIHKEMSDFIDYIKKETSQECEYKALEIIKQKADEKTLKEINKTIEGNTLICKYNVQDSVLVIRLFEKLSVWISLIELSSIVRVTPMEYFTRGQQVRCVAQIYHEASHKGIVLTQREKDYVFFNGGRVEDPIVGFWPLVICFDFNSLYPSIMIAYNICYTTLLKSLQGIDEKDYHYFKIDQEEPAVVKQPKFDRFDYGQYDEDFDENDEDKNKKVMRTYEVGFVKAERKKGLLPTILETLLSNRSKAKKTKKKFNDIMKQLENDIINPLKKNEDLKFKDIKNTKIVDHLKKAVQGITDESRVLDFKDQINNEFYARNVDYKIYDSRQLGLKISANSLYGYVGAQISGKYPLIEASMAITARGRNLIIESGLFTKKHFNATTVYGDTDSIMIHVPEINDDPTKAWEMADIIEKKINGTKDKYDENGKLVKKGEKGIFPPPLNLEFEKAMRALFMKKKHYAYMEYAEDGSIIKEKNSDKEALNVKGIVLARRDNCLWVRETYETMIRGIFSENTIETSFDIIINAVVEVIELKFNIIEKLSIVKSMGSNYKSSTFSLAIFSDLMKKLGRPVQPGERFPYVIVNDHQKRIKVGQKMRTIEFFLEEWETAGLKYGEKVPEDWEVPEGLYPPEEIDSVYYITNVLSNPIDKLFEKGYARILEKYQDKKYEPEFNKRLKPVSVITPLKMISLILKDHKKQIEEHGAKCLVYKLLSLKDWFRN